MSGIEPLAPISATLTNPASLGAQSERPAGAASGGSFLSMLQAGAQGVEEKVAHANEMVRAFALDDTTPVHQVMIALEEARMAVDLAMQVRARFVEGYREMMNMQL